MEKPLTPLAIADALLEADGVVSTAAHRLGVSPRTLSRRLDDLDGLDLFRNGWPAILREGERLTMLEAVVHEKGVPLRRFLTQATIKPAWMQATDFRKWDCAASDE